MTKLEINITNKLMDIGILPDRGNLKTIREIITLVKENEE
jgi:hypothetical protein